MNFEIKWMILVIFSVKLAVSSRLSSIHGSRQACEPIKIDLCKMNGYNMTTMPNLAKNILQADAKMELETFMPLFQTKCANELQFFLCSVYVPFCNEQNPMMEPLGPCRPTCERVKAGCQQFLKQFGFPWPEKLNCDKFPIENGPNSMCMEGPGENAAVLNIPASSINDIQTNPILMTKMKEEIKTVKKYAEKYDKHNSLLQILENNVKGQEPAQGINHRCSKFKKSRQYHFIERTEECVPNCTSDITFTSDEKATAKILTISISAICFLISFACLITLMIDECGFATSSQNRGTKNSVLKFAYSVPPYFSTFSCVLYSFGYLLSQLINPEDYCLQSDENITNLLLAREGHRNLPCIIIYLLIFFFGSAISAWWTIITVSWCIALTSSSSLSSSNRNSDRVSSVCHAYAWGIPAALTVAGIVAHKVESDELLSICLPGAGFNDESLLIFMLIPESFQIVLGLLFYVVGIVLATIKKSSTNIQSEGSSSKRAKQETKLLDMLQNRVLIYGAIYIVMKIVSLGTVVYEYISRQKWLSSSYSDDEPIIYIFYLRIATSQLVGILCLCWVCRGSALKSWQSCCKSCFWRKQNKRDTPNTPSSFPQVAYHQQNQVDNPGISIQPTTFNQMHGNL